MLSEISLGLFAVVPAALLELKKLKVIILFKSYKNRFSEKIRNIFYPNILYFQLFVYELLMLGSTRIFLQALVSVFELEPFYEDIRQYYSYLRPSRDSLSDLVE